MRTLLLLSSLALALPGFAACGGEEDPIDAPSSGGSGGSGGGGGRVIDGGLTAPVDAMSGIDAQQALPDAQAAAE